jgi:multisubunit Na+/H+ antiporter MnhF subunit
MDVAAHPAAIDHLPFFLPGPDGSDTLFTVMAVFLVVILLLVGNFYLRLHSLPEQMAHGASKVQLQLVGVLGLLALFTHNHLFWVAALLIALVPVPDFSRPLFSMADSLERIAGGAPRPTPQPEPAPEPHPPAAVVADAPTAASTETRG